MRDEMKKVPRLRFRGFSEDWEQRKLNEVSDIYDGTHQTPKYQDDGVMFLSVENIKTLTSNKFISREAFEDEFKIRPQRGDVLMTRIGDIGTANVVETDEDLAYYVSLALFKSEELNPYFLQASIYAPFVQDQIWKRTLHIAFPKKINKNEIGQVPINVPTLAEQTKIGSFFKQLDNTITLHQRKLDQLKELKKAYLQLMFPKKDETVPRVRFADFEDDWQLCKLGETFSIIMGQSPNSENYTENPDDYILVQGNSDMKNNKVVPRIWTTQVTKKAEKGDLILSVRAPVGEIGKTDYNVVLGRGVAAVKGNDFIFQQLRKMKDSGYWTRYSTGSTFESINSNDIKEALINIPNKDEQQKIGDLFTHLDDAIILNQNKLNQLKSLKKSYLQNMFI